MEVSELEIVEDAEKHGYEHFEARAELFQDAITAFDAIYKHNKRGGLLIKVVKPTITGFAGKGAVDDEVKERLNNKASGFPPVTLNFIVTTSNAVVCFHCYLFIILLLVALLLLLLHGLPSEEQCRRLHHSDKTCLCDISLLQFELCGA